MKRKSLLKRSLAVLLAAAMILKDYMEDREELTKGILRGNQGDAPRTEAYTAETEDGFQSEIQVEVMPRESSAEESRKLLEQAKAAGVKEAAANLDELRKKEADNQLFDSFE